MIFRWSLGKRGRVWNEIFVSQRVRVMAEDEVSNSSIDETKLTKTSICKNPVNQG